MDFFDTVHAQDVEVQADEVAKATIPFTGPSEPTPTGFNITGTPNVTITGTIVVTPTTEVVDPMISLETPQTQIASNEKVKVKITINTAGKNIKSFAFTVNYDPEFFKIVDSDTDTPNVQITFNDTFFISQLNEVDTSTGTITIGAASEEGTAQISGRAVAEFELISLKEGVTQVSLDIQNSSLLDANNADLLKKTSAPIDFAISSIPITIAPTVPHLTPTGKLPKNGIFDGLGAGNALISGVLLVSVGIYLYKLQRNAQKKV
jgi:hypothetical protein